MERSATTAKANETPACPKCGKSMLAARDQYKDGSWAKQCWPCAVVNGR